MIRHRFKKRERLRHKRHIQQLFIKGKRLKLSLLRLYYLPSTQLHDQVLFCVPKRSVRKAVERNRIKRALREAYRLTKYMINGEEYNTQRFFIAYLYLPHPHKKPVYANFLQDIKSSMLHLQKAKDEAGKK